MWSILTQKVSFKNPVRIIIIHRYDIDRYIHSGNMAYVGDHIVFNCYMGGNHVKTIGLL